MNQKMIQEIGKSQRLLIVNKLKRTQGLSVNELSQLLGMSYMGVKQHCVDLHKGGYLDTWRRPKPLGRPEMIYRLTRKAHELFPTASNQVTLDLLEGANHLFGPAAAEKLLFLMFHKKTDFYLSKIKGETVAERAAQLAKRRDAEGHMADWENSDGGRIVEYHSPILDLILKFPIVERLEKEMFERVIKASVRRDQVLTAGLYLCTFRLGA